MVRVTWLDSIRVIFDRSKKAKEQQLQVKPAAPVQKHTSDRDDVTSKQKGSTGSNIDFRA